MFELLLFFSHTVEIVENSPIRLKLYLSYIETASITERSFFAHYTNADQFINSKDHGKDTFLSFVFIAVALPHSSDCAKSILKIKDNIFPL